MRRQHSGGASPFHAQAITAHKPIMKCCSVHYQGFFLSCEDCGSGTSSVCQLGVSQDLWMDSLVVTGLGEWVVAFLPQDPHVSDFVRECCDSLSVSMDVFLLTGIRSMATETSVGVVRFGGLWRASVIGSVAFVCVYMTFPSTEMTLALSQSRIQSKGRIKTWRMRIPGMPWFSDASIDKAREESKHGECEFS